MQDQHTDGPNESTRITVMIFMRETFHRVTLVSFLQEQSDLCVLSQTNSVAKLARSIEQSPPNIVLFDTNAARLTTILHFVHLLRKVSPKSKLIALCSAPSVQVAAALLDAEVLGIVYTIQDPKELLHVIDRAMHGVYTIPEQIAKQIVFNNLRRINLTQREMETAIYVTQGLSNVEIARKMGITESTIKANLSHIFTKLNIRSRTQLSSYIMRNGIMPYHEIPDPVVQKEA